MIATTRTKAQQLSAGDRKLAWRSVGVWYRDSGNGLVLITGLIRSSGTYSIGFGPAKESVSPAAPARSDSAFAQAGATTIRPFATALDQARTALSN